MISVSLNYEGWNGGPYPYRGVRTLNFGGEDFGDFRLTEVFGGVAGCAKIANIVLKYCAKEFNNEGVDLEEYLFPYSDAAGPIENMAMPTQWLDKFNFNEEGATFYFDDCLPHAVGSFSVFVPWSKFTERIAEQYRKTPLAEFLVKVTSA